MTIALSLLVALLMAPSPLGPDLEREAREIETKLIAPCCWSQQVSVHFSPAADQIRQDVRKMLAEGKTRDQILDAYVAQYGERILAEPPAHGFNLVLYVLPVMLLILTGAALFLLVRAMTQSTPVAAVAGPPGLPVPTDDDPYARRLQDELEELE